MHAYFPFIVVHPLLVYFLLSSFCLHNRSYKHYPFWPGVYWTVFSHEYTVHLHRVTSSFLLNEQTRFIHYTSTQLEATDTFQNDDVIIILLQLWHRVFIHEWSWVQSMNFKLAGSKFTTYLKESAGFKF